MAWHVRDPLDLVSMRTAADVLLGTHDFRSFCRRRPGTDPAEPIVRRVTEARWSVDAGPEALDAARRPGEDLSGEVAPRLLRFEISAGSFCHQMVRSLVSSLVEVGRGRENAAGLLARLRAATRHAMPDPAPARGLCLVAVDYGDTPPGSGPADEGGLPPPLPGPILVRRLSDPREHRDAPGS